MARKGQVTAFIVVGILIVAAAALLWYVWSISIDVPDEPEPITPGTVGSLAQYVEGCIRDPRITPLAIRTVAENGGMFSLDPGSFRTYYHQDYRYLLTRQSNVMPSRQQMEDEINSRIFSPIQQCIQGGIDIYKSQGYDVTREQMQMDVRITVDEVVVELDYPIRMELGESVQEVSDFYVSIDMPLGRLYDLAFQIVNAEAADRHFNKDMWMYEHGSDISIHKHKPYPDITYDLVKFSPDMTDNLTFRFAIQGEDSAGGTQTWVSPANLGCCFNPYDSSYHAFYNQQDCDDIPNAAYYSNDPACSSPAAASSTGLTSFPSSKTVCGDHDCRDCGKNIPHGSSWCVFDAIEAPGYATVGSRHFKRSCIDGEVYYEECRDFREGICIEGYIEEEDGQRLNYAQCRPNRWQDCVLQGNLQDCHDREARDCYWLSPIADTLMNSQGKCIPYVSPGFRFWNRENDDICDYANNYGRCIEGELTCRREWIDDSAMHCFMLGDCGNYYNFAASRGMGSYTNYQLDLLDESVSTRIYEVPSWEESEFRITKLKLDKFESNRAAYSPVRDSEIDSFFLWFKDEASSWEICEDAFDCVDPFNLWPEEPLEENFNKFVVGGAYCDVWNAPKEGQCSICSADPHRPCSEYRCRSVGTNCVPIQQEGVWECYDSWADVDYYTPLVIEFGSIQPPYTVRDESLSTDSLLASGKSIDENVIPYSTVEFTLSTNRWAECSVSSLPLSDFSASHLNALNIIGGAGISTFGDTHTVRVTAYPPELLFERLNEIFNTSTLLEGTTLGNFTYPGMENPILVVPDEYQNVINILVSEAEQDRFYFFFRCRDSKGTYDEQNFYVSMEIEDVPVSPPDVSLVYPGDGKDEFQEVPFRFNVQDDTKGSLRCGLYINYSSGWTRADTTYVAPNSTYEISYNLTPGTLEKPNSYLWNIGCKDENTESFGQENHTVFVYPSSDI
ncbi:hypothetical protein GF351_01350 [Candidatus Woesearchaeota archaeon]|nr:hypothetical protein [Candidatus Woesearchaeota archaeon]